MKDSRQFLTMFLSLWLFWVLLNSSLALDVLIIGAAVSAIIALLLPKGIAFFGEFRVEDPAAWVAAAGYFAYFFKELLLSNMRLAAIVLHPSLPVNPGIVRARTKLKSRMGRLLLANSITLTPGTLTVELDGEWLYIHWVTVAESATTAKATEKIVAGFERYLEVMYG